MGMCCVSTQSVSDVKGYRALSFSPDTKLVCVCHFLSITDINLKSMETLWVCVRAWVCVSLTWVIEFHGLLFHEMSSWLCPYFNIQTLGLPLSVRVDHLSCSMLPSMAPVSVISA